MASRSDCWLHLLQYLMTNAEIAASIKVAGRSIHPDIVTAITAALDAKDAERDRYRVVLEEIARDERLAGTEWAKAARTALKGKSGEAVGGRVVVPAKEKCEECNGSGTSCTGGNCCMICNECNGTGTA